MKLFNMAMLIAGAAGIAYAGEKIPARQRKVMVCIEPGAYALQVKDAQGQASTLFRRIGVRLEWHEQRFCSPDGNAIQVKFSGRTPEGEHPGALAYALPYERTKIVVFYDRIQNGDPKRVTYLTAYVLAHEITHILQGAVRHSERGIMKAHWDRVDYFEMENGQLNFAPEDVGLISRGLDKREAVTTTCSHSNACAREMNRIM